MIRSELVQKLCTDFPDLTQREVEGVVSAIFDSITDQLAKGGVDGLIKFLTAHNTRSAG